MTITIKPGSNRIKATAAPAAVPQCRAAAEAAIAEIGRLQRDRTALEAAFNDQVAPLRQRYEAQAARIDTQVRLLTLGVQSWCEVHRHALCGKAKFAWLASGKISWRLRPPKVTVCSADTVIASLKTLGLARFIRTKEEINKDALLAEPDAAAAVPGVSIGSAGEDFIIEPHQMALAGGHAG